MRVVFIELNDLKLTHSILSRECFKVLTEIEAQLYHSND